MNAILLAGGIPRPDEPLYAESAGRGKALIDVAGKPMAQWLLDALSASQRVENVTIIGVDPPSGLTCTKPLTFLPNGKGLLDNVLLGLAHVRQQSPDTTHILLASTDIPAVTPAIIDWVIESTRATDSDLNYLVVERPTMEARFPDSRRSFVRLRDVEVCGGDLNVLSVNLAEKTELWERLVAARKSARRQAGLLGYDLLFLLLTRRITLKQAETRISQRLDIKGHVIISPYAELAMDVDKPEQLAILRQDLVTKAGEA
jgi:molybdopterin-guanine dinucleotide biosynthesis protein A